MSSVLKPYAVVKVRQLDQEPAEYNGWLVNQRLPQIGDVGTLIDVLSTSGSPNKYVVESSAPDGTTIWLADFFEEELEFVQA
jgi:hypothetical protein